MADDFPTEPPQKDKEESKRSHLAECIIALVIATIALAIAVFGGLVLMARPRPEVVFPAAMALYLIFTMGYRLVTIAGSRLHRRKETVMGNPNIRRSDRFEAITDWFWPHRPIGWAFRIVVLIVMLDVLAVKFAPWRLVAFVLACVLWSICGRVFRLMDQSVERPIRQGPLQQISPANQQRLALACSFIGAAIFVYAIMHP